MLYFLIPLILGLISLAVFLYFRVKEQRVIAVIIKGVTSLFFISTALVAWLTSSNPTNSLGVFVLIALFFGLLGDVFLDIKFITKKHEHLFTVLGFFAFAIGHIFFTTGLFINFFDFYASPLYLILPIVMTSLLVVATLLMEKISAIRYQNMKPFVVIYGIFLFFTMSIYCSASIQTGFQNITILLMFIGLILFMASDLVLNNTYFAPGFTTPAFIIINHVLYYIAQFLIASSLFFLA